MKTRRLMLAGLIAAAIGAVGVQAQAYAVGADGQVQQEKAAPAIPADQQATKEQIAKLFEVLRLRQQMDTMMQAMSTSMTQQMRQTTTDMLANLPNHDKLSAKQTKTIEDFQSKWMDRAMHMIPYDDFIADATGVYQRHFTKEDVDAVTAFYSSPAGQRLLDEQPAIMKEYMPLVMARVSVKSKELTSEMMKDMAALTKELEQEAPKDPVAKKPASAPVKQ